MKVTEPDAPDEAELEFVNDEELVESPALPLVEAPPLPHAAETAARNRTANKRNDILIESLLQTRVGARRDASSPPCFIGG
jgi:hypothetical protein